MATQAEIATIAQLAATLLAAPRDSAAASVGANTLEAAIRTAITLYDNVGHRRDADRSAGR